VLRPTALEPPPFAPFVARAALAALVVTSCTATPGERGGAIAEESDPAPPAPNGARPAFTWREDGEWRMAAKNYASTRYSGLDQITRENARNLRVAWTFATGNLRGHEAAPLVVNGTMYIVTPFPNKLHALDLRQDGALKWTYAPPLVPAAAGVACCDVVNRGAAYADGRIFFNTLDNQVAAVDAESGKEAWRTRVGEINRGESMTMAPLFVKGKVIVGNSGGEFGVRGWITALDAGSGEIAWRAYNTGPDAEVLIGERFRPFYESHRGTDLGMTTWPRDRWKVGGGSVWGWISYDPELDLIYHGTGNPGPWNPEQRPGDNKWTSTVFARDPDDGQAVWAYQLSPHDLHDYDGINESLLLDLPIDGRERKTLVRTERDGYVYVFDRATGEVLSATPFVHITTSLGVDTRAGRPIYNPATEPKLGKIVEDICPASPGGKDWQPTAFSPRTGYIYIPHQNLCQNAQSLEANYLSGTPYVGMNVRMYAGPGGHRGEFDAWDPVGKRKVWSIKERFPVWSGTLVTAGDVAFYGTMEGWFKAVDAVTGAELWRFKTESGIIGQPVTYRGPDGKQYVAVLSGVGGWSGAIVSLDMDPRDTLGALGFAGAMQDLKEATTRGGTLYVFALP
jgi:PQQ-dependent dehydrogenase (methanol/ethanol family)